MTRAAAVANVGMSEREREEGGAASACVIVIWGTAAAVLSYGGGIAWLAWGQRVCEPARN